ncbi:thermonuclease family protein [Paenibacillus periandrae]|uniref:thermonuclease family protein n=1 Tax=Paenibacillus periandrae TaxID=1761741 RepID=UPI001F09292B|nr:thermonuclease family protein [Paenibacillus periandrae]
MKKLLALTLLFIFASGCGQTTPAKTQQPTVPVASKTTQPIVGPTLAQSASTTTVTTKATAAVNDKKLIDAKVNRVIDGDTLEVTIGGKKETVGMILVDTPETKKPNTPAQPFGLEAFTFTKETLEGKNVKLERDVSERDQNKRLLYYVYIGDKMFNETLLEKGLARVAVFPPDIKYVDHFREIQKKAQEAKLGIWSIENYATDKGFDDSKAKKETGIDMNAKFETHKPAPAVKPKETPTASSPLYNSCAEVKKAGKAPLHRGDPGYSSKLDRDNDGIACE